MMSLLEDEYLSGFFWQEPSAKRAGQAKQGGVQCPDLVHRGNAGP